MKEKLKKLLAAIGDAVKLAEADVTAGEHHMKPVYASLQNAEAATARRIFQIEDSERDLAEQKAEHERAVAAEAAKEKAIADRKKFEADAIADAEAKLAKKNKPADKE